MNVITGTLLACIIIALVASGGAVVALSSWNRSTGEEAFYPITRENIESGNGVRIRDLYVVITSGMIIVSLFMYVFLVYPISVNEHIMDEFRKRTDILLVATNTAWWGLSISATGHLILNSWLHARLKKRGTTWAYGLVIGIVLLAFASVLVPSLTISANMHVFFPHDWMSQLPPRPFSLELIRPTGILAIFFGVVSTSISFGVAAVATASIERKVSKQFRLLQSPNARSSMQFRSLSYLHGPRNRYRTGRWRECIAITTTQGKEYNGADQRNHEPATIPSESIEETMPKRATWKPSEQDRPSRIPDTLASTAPRAVARFSNQLAKLKVLDVTPLVLYNALSRYDNLVQLWPAYEMIAREHEFFDAIKGFTHAITPLSRLHKFLYIGSSPIVFFIILISSWLDNPLLTIIFLLSGAGVFLVLFGVYLNFKEKIRGREQFIMSCSKPVALVTDLLERNKQLLSGIIDYVEPRVKAPPWQREQRRLARTEIKAKTRIKEARQLAFMHAAGILASLFAPMLWDPPPLNQLLTPFTFKLPKLTQTPTMIAFFTSWQAIVAANVIVMGVILGILLIKLSMDGARFSHRLNWAYIPYWIHPYTIFLGFLLSVEWQETVSFLALCLAIIMIVQVFLAINLLRERALARTSRTR